MVFITFGAQSNADSICEDVNTFENAGSALVRKLDLLVSTTGQCGLSGLCHCTTERPG